MSGSQELSVREKQELAKKEEKTTPGRYFVPAADIFETEQCLTVVMEMPGVKKDHLNIEIEEDVLRIEGQLDFSAYEGMDPVYTEYNIGHYARGFTLSGKIDRESISARLDDGVLTLILPKAKEAMPQRITIN